MCIFRFWRDSGYVIGALLSGIVAARFGIQAAFIAVSILTAAAAFIIEVRMCCTAKLIWKSEVC